MFADQPEIGRSLTLHEAMARAILFNLDGRQRVMEQALSERQLDLSRFDLLPNIVARGAYDGRNVTDASVSESILTASQSLEPSTSADNDILTGDLTLSWNVLDFGVSWVTALQQADRALIAYERRRRVIHTIIQDVRAAYWRAVAAERLLERLPPLVDRIEQARSNARRIEEQRLQAPLEALSYQRTLVETLRQLQDLRQELVLAKTQLAALINARPSDDFDLEVPSVQTDDLPALPFSPEEMELLALAYRPEIREEDYQARVTAHETRKAILRMLPGIEFDYAFNYSNNVFLVNQGWESYGVQVTWNLLNLFNGPTNLRFAEAQSDVVEARRQALSMAVLTQAHVSYINYLEAQNSYDMAAELADIDSRILDQISAAGQARQVGELTIIQAELNDLVAQLRLDLAFANVQNAMGQVYLTIGADPLPASLEGDSVAAMTEAIAQTEAQWMNGDVYLNDDWTLEALLQQVNNEPELADGDEPSATPTVVADPATGSVDDVEPVAAQPSVDASEDGQDLMSALPTPPPATETDQAAAPTRSVSAISPQPQVISSDTAPRISTVAARTSFAGETVEVFRTASDAIPAPDFSQRPQSEIRPAALPPAGVAYPPRRPIRNTTVIQPGEATQTPAVPEGEEPTANVTAPLFELPPLEGEPDASATAPPLIEEIPTEVQEDAATTVLPGLPNYRLPALEGDLEPAAAITDDETARQAPAAPQPGTSVVIPSVQDIDEAAPLTPASQIVRPAALQPQAPPTEIALPLPDEATDAVDAPIAGADDGLPPRPPSRTDALILQQARGDANGIRFVRQVVPPAALNSTAADSPALGTPAGTTPVPAGVGPVVAPTEPVSVPAGAIDQAAPPAPEETAPTVRSTTIPLEPTSDPNGIPSITAVDRPFG